MGGEEFTINNILDSGAWDILLFSLKFAAGLYSTLCLISFIYLFIKKQTLTKVIKETTEVINDLQYKPQPQSLFDRRWMGIKELMDSENYSDYRAAIIDADNMLDEALSQLGFKGGNLGDRLKRLDQGKLSNIEELWQARKLRNTFVHNPDYQPKRMDLMNAINIYERSLRELGFLNI